MNYRCPWCDKELPREEMKFHVGVPLCMDVRKDKAGTTEIHGGYKPVPVDGIKYRYFGRKGIEKLIDASLAHGYGDPPLVLEDYVDHSEDDTGE